jgi:hypothetical protein
LDTILSRLSSPATKILSVGSQKPASVQSILFLVTLPVPRSGWELVCFTFGCLDASRHAKFTASGLSNSRLQPPNGNKILPQQRFGEDQAQQVRCNNVQNFPLGIQNQFSISLEHWEGLSTLPMVHLWSHSYLCCFRRQQER